MTLKHILCFCAGYIISKHIYKQKYWYIYKNEKHCKLEYSDVISYLYNDFKNSNDKNTTYELFDFIVSFDENEKYIKLEETWYKMY